MNNSRRLFLKHSSAAVIGASLLPSSAGARPAQDAGPGAPMRPFGDGTLRVALVGCGGRGTGAAWQALSTAGDVKLVAMADAFSDRLEGCLGQLQGAFPEKVEVPEERRFVGFDAYEQAIAAGVDLVILTTPPGFRPIHFEHAVAQGKHVFMEKPVAVDAPGVRRVLAAARAADAAGLKVGVGLQRRHQDRYLQALERIREGAIGDLTLLRCYWNGAGVWVNPREAGQTEMTYQMRNWYYFNWLCGDHITEQHIHNLDVCNWLAGDFPVEAQGQGGRQVRVGKEYGEIFDHHMVEYTYASGLKMISQCRHIPNTWSSVNEYAHGTHGTADLGSGRIETAGGWKWRYREEEPNPYQVEHDDLFAAVRSGTPYNEAEYGAKSTMTSILGRMATYSGKVVRWDEALASELDLAPERYDWDALPRVLPDAEGNYPIPTPGLTQVL